MITKVEYSVLFRKILILPVELKNVFFTENMEYYRKNPSYNCTKLNKKNSQLFLEILKHFNKGICIEFIIAKQEYCI